jgi:chloramphenicol 3-O-phosphotransferase
MVRCCHDKGKIADDIGWHRDWLNDGVKGFLSAAGSDLEAKRLFCNLSV